MKTTLFKAACLLAAVTSVPAHAVLFSATLPASRASQVGVFTTFFATLINADGATTATNCSVSLATPIDASFSYQTTDPATNQPTGAPNTPVDIPPASVQTFLLALTATAEVPPTEVTFNFDCSNFTRAATVPGLNTLQFSATTQPTPDIVALAATLNNDGITNVPDDGSLGFFSVAAVNLGISAQIAAVPRTTGVQPDTLLICETDQNTGACLAGATPTVTTTIAAQATPTFAVFLADSSNIPFDPANNRLFVDFTENGVLKGSTSVAIRTGTPPIFGGPDPDASLYQAAFVPGTTTYEFGFNSIPNIPITGAPADTDYERCAMLHDGADYRLYCFQLQSENTLYQFAFNPTTGNYEYGYNSIPTLDITGAPAAADPSTFTMLHDGLDYRLYMGSKLDEAVLWQFAFNPATGDYEYGYNSIPTIAVDGAPADTDFTRTAMVHDGADYRYYAAKDGTSDRFYQFAFNPATSAYEYGYNSIPELTLTNIPDGIEGRDFSMLHDGVDFRYYVENPPPTQPVVLSLNQAAFNPGTADYEYAFNSIPNIPVSGAPDDTDVSRGAMLHDGTDFRLYLFKEGSDTTLYQFAFNPATASYEYGYNSIAQLEITGAPASASARSISMLHDGTDYRLYLDDDTTPGRVHQFAFNPATGNYEFGYNSIPTIDTTGAPADADFSRRAMLHDGTDFRMYVFRAGSATELYQFAFNPATGTYEYGYNSIPNLELIGMPAVSQFRDAYMLHDGLDYRLYQPQLHGN